MKQDKTCKNNVSVKKLEIWRTFDKMTVNRFSALLGDNSGSSLFNMTTVYP